MTAEEYSKQKEKEACCGTEFCTSEIAKAFNEGMEEMKQRLMKDAVDGEIYFSMDTLQYRIITQPLGNFHHGDKVKLIIIKEE